MYDVLLNTVIPCLHTVIIIAPLLRAAVHVKESISNLSKAVPNPTNADSVKLKMNAVIAKTTKIVDFSIKQASIAQNTLLHVTEAPSLGEAHAVHAAHVAVREQVMLLPRNCLATCGNNLATAIDTKTTPAILAMVPLTKDPLCKQVEVCEAGALCKAVGVGAVECAEDAVLVEHLPLHICRLNLRTKAIGSGSQIRRSSV